MQGSTKVVVFLAFAAFAVLGVLRPAAAPQVEFTKPGYVSGYKKFFADPVMGIRGDATVLRFPVSA